METDVGLRFDNRQIVLDELQYTIIDSPFLGDLSYYGGQTYGGIDTFQHYFPKFPTSLQLENPSQSIVKEGDFAAVCTNGYMNNAGAGKRTYWITDYLQFSSPYYTITNQFVDKNNLLVISDSMALRTISYLSLLCHKITILDPRFFGERDYLSQVLTENFDAVLVIPTSNLLKYGIGGYNANIISFQALLVETERGRLYDIAVTARNVGSGVWSGMYNFCMHLWCDGTDIGIRAGIEEGKLVRPMEEYTFVFKEIAPDMIMRDLSAQMLKEGSFYFGESKLLYGVDPEHPKLYDAEIIGHTAPAIINHTDSYSMDIKVKNIGQAVWSESEQIRLCIWQDGYDGGYRVILPADILVAPGEEYIFTLEGFMVPSADYTYLEFQMVQEGIRYFGERERTDIQAIS